MYRKNQYHQFSITDFNQPIGLKMNPENRWVKKASAIPWEAIEESMQNFFPVKQACRRNLSGWRLDHC